MNRLFVVGDIHGCNSTFRKLIFDGLTLTREDTLYLLGDYLDRGADSRGVVQTLLDLQADGFIVRPLLGNHEAMLLKAYDSGDVQDLMYWLVNGGDATLDSYGVNSPTDLPLDHIGYIRKLPLYYETEHHVLVHAGLDFSLENPLADEGSMAMLWGRSSTVDPKKIGGRKLVTGHTVVAIDRLMESLASNLIRLDNGCFMGKKTKGFGNLIALELIRNEIFVQEYIG